MKKKITFPDWTSPAAVTITRGGKEGKRPVWSEYTQDPADWLSLRVTAEIAGGHPQLFARYETAEAAQAARLEENRRAAWGKTPLPLFRIGKRAGGGENVKRQFCLPCLLELKKAGKHDIQRGGGANMKITCWKCKRRRYGAEYEIPWKGAGEMVKFLIGGSPCTHWSIAQNKARETEPGGIGWELFKNHLIAKEKVQPDFFLCVNNKSVAEAIKARISEELGTPLQYINSAFVSAQNRWRFYAHNIPGVEQLEDRHIMLADILESVTGEPPIPLNTAKSGKEQCLREPVIKTVCGI